LSRAIINGVFALYQNNDNHHCTLRTSFTHTYIGIGVKITHGFHALIVLLIHETLARLIKRGALRQDRLRCRICFRTVVGGSGFVVRQWRRSGMQCSNTRTRTNCPPFMYPWHARRRYDPFGKSVRYAESLPGTFRLRFRRRHPRLGSEKEWTKEQAHAKQRDDSRPSLSQHHVQQTHLSKFGRCRGVKKVRIETPQWFHLAKGMMDLRMISD
jgi:hypothetical protein